MKFPRIFDFKCPSLAWERITYHCLRIVGILIGIAAIVYFMYDGKIRDDGSRRKARERLIRRRSKFLLGNDSKREQKRDLQRLDLVSVSPFCSCCSHEY